jgi:hypothetical protein
MIGVGSIQHMLSDSIYQQYRTLEVNYASNIAQALLVVHSVTGPTLATSRTFLFAEPGELN